MTYQYVEGWPRQSREAAQLVIDRHGELDEATETQLVLAPPRAVEAGRRDPCVL